LIRKREIKGIFSFEKRESFWEGMRPGERSDGEVRRRGALGTEILRREMLLI